MSFGFGMAICPECYRGEHQFLFFDHSYWLNRMVDPLSHDRRAILSDVDRTTVSHEYPVTSEATVSPP